jgi:hypothetical protein
MELDIKTSIIVTYGADKKEVTLYINGNLWDRENIEFNFKCGKKLYIYLIN